jgi:ABC-type dipeptide/oligopeptide/nickel transport system permease component
MVLIIIIMVSLIVFFIVQLLPGNTLIIHSGQVDRQGIFSVTQHLRTNPVLYFAPGFAIMLVVFALNMVGNGLRDALDPRLRGIL